MKNKRIIISISLCLVLLITLLVSVYSTDTSSEEVYIANDNAMLAVTLDGERIYAFPSKGMYRVDVDCTNATGTWDYDNWKLSIADLTDEEAYCYIDFVTISKTYLNDYIISLAGTEQGTGEIVDENGIRYEGKDPNNYIWYNNELWRIIGVFGEESHGVSDTNLVKIIRVNSLGGLVWDKSNTNNWIKSSLNSLLNTYYYNATDGTDSGYCYGYSSTITTNCDYTNIGLSSIYRSMVQEVTWYLGGYSSVSVTADNIYTYERSGDYVYTGRPTSTTGNIGLMFASDYAYSVLSSDCDRSITLDSYAVSSCGGKSWFNTNSSNYTWMITPYSGSSNGVFDIIHTSEFGYNVVVNGFSVYPTLYLSSSVYVLDGTGEISDPYIIAMD